MKKAMSILFTLLLLMSVVITPAFATGAEEMIPVVVSVPSEWESPNLWAWADDGTNAFDAWPGEAMEQLDDGWYYTYVPNFVQNVIVNANQDGDNGVQTDGIVVEAGKAVWVTVADDATAKVSYEAQNTAEIPEYVEKFIVHAYVPLSWKTVNMWAWSAPDGTNAFEAWPGDAMVEGENGWFTGKAPVWINSLIINGNEGTVQTEDISVEGKELWITVYEDLTYELTYEDPDKAVDNVKVYAQVPDGWDAPNCWAWSAPDGTNAFTSWPGEALTQDGDWYTIEVPGWINSVIINANEGAIQTADISVDTGKDIWLVVSAEPDAEGKHTATVTYEEPSISETTAPETTAPETTEAPEAPTEAPAEQKTHNSSTGWIIGGVAGVVVIGAAIAIAVITKKKKK